MKKRPMKEEGYIDAEILQIIRWSWTSIWLIIPLVRITTNSFASLPPRENMLDVEIQAGEKNFRPFGHQGSKNQSVPVVNRKSGAALLIPISTLHPR